MKKKIHKLLDFILPLTCTVCRKQDILSRKIGICRKCLPQPPDSEAEECPVCKNDIHSHCSYCYSRNVFFDELVYLRPRHDFEKSIIRKIKFGKEPHLAYLFRKDLRAKIRHWQDVPFSGIAYLVSNRKTLRERPYHPCQPVLDRLQKWFNIPLFCPVEKKSSELQSSKTYQNRFLHARTAFRLYSDYKNHFAGEYILVDDVFTTGATINEIARMMKENGAEKIRVLTLIKGESR